MARLDSYSSLTAAPAVTDTIPITSSGNTRNVPVNVLFLGRPAYDIRDYGAVLDMVTLTNGAINSGSHTVTSTPGPFSPGDVGKYLLIFGAGGGGVPLGGLITTFNATDSVNVANAASVTVTNAKFNFGTNNSTALQSAVDAVATAGGGIVQLPVGNVFCASNMSGYLKHNVWIRGAGVGATTVVCGENVQPISFGTGDHSQSTTNNPEVSDLTVDMNNVPGATYGIVMANCANSVLRRVAFKNQKNGAQSMFFWGVNSNASSAMKSNGLVMDECDFGTSDAAWEAVTLAQGINVKITNTTFHDKTSQSCFLNYGSYNVSLANCHFRNTGNALNGFGNTTFVGCDFFNASVRVQAANTIFLGCTWDNLPGTYGGGITILGYRTDPSESGWDTPGPNVDVSLKNTKIIGCTFRRCSSNAISAGSFTSGGSMVLSADDLTIINCSFELTEWQGIYVKTNYLVLQGNSAWNNGQLGTSSTSYNYVFGATKAFISQNRSYDNQGTPTVTRDYFIDNNEPTVITSMNIYLNDNNFEITGTPHYYTGGGFTDTRPSAINLGSLNLESMTPASAVATGRTGDMTYDSSFIYICTATNTWKRVAIATW